MTDLEKQLFAMLNDILDGMVYAEDLESITGLSKYMVFCDEVDNLGFSGAYFPTEQQAERAIGDAEQLLGRELACSVQFRAEYPNTDYAAWSSRGW